MSTDVQTLQRPFEHALRIEDIINGTPFIMYSKTRGIIGLGYFVIGKKHDVLYDTRTDTYEQTKILSIQKDKDPTQPDHRVRTELYKLGLAPSASGWDPDVFTVSPGKIFEDGYRNWIIWLTEQKHSRVARDTLHRLGYDDLILP